MKALIIINNKLKLPTSIMSNALAIAKYLLEIYIYIQDCSMIAEFDSSTFISKFNSKLIQGMPVFPPGLANLK